MEEREIKDYPRIDKLPRVTVEEARRFMFDCYKAVGVNNEHARAEADLLASADYFGHYSQGMNRLEMILKEIQMKICDANATPKILRESLATAWVDGQNGLGAVVGNFCMDLAKKKAREVGVAIVVAKGSTSLGLTAHYARRAAKDGMIGFVTSNSSPLVVPTRAKDVALGTNPISVMVRGANSDSFILDMATSIVAVGKVEMKIRKEQPIPSCWIMHDQARDQKEIYTNTLPKLLPLGGHEVNSGYKGVGLAMLAEILGAVLADAAYAQNVLPWKSTEGKANLGQCFIVVDPICFAPGFEGRVYNFLDDIRSLEPLDPRHPVLVPGDPERNHMKHIDKKGGIRYNRNMLESCMYLAAEHGVRPLEFVDY